MRSRRFAERPTMQAQLDAAYRADVDPPHAPFLGHLSDRAIEALWRVRIGGPPFSVPHRKYCEARQLIERARACTVAARALLPRVRCTCRGGWVRWPHGVRSECTPCGGTALAPCTDCLDAARDLAKALTWTRPELSDAEVVAEAQLARCGAHRPPANC